MTPHNVTHEQLVQFVLGELPAEQAREIQAHLSDCEPCSRSVGRLQSLLDCAERMSAAREDERDVESANRGVLLAAEANSQNQLRRVATSRAAFFGRTTMNHRMTKWAVAAVVALAVIAGWNLFAGGGSGKAYARLVDRLHNARTLTYSIITQTGVEDMPTVRTDMAFKEPSHLRTSTADGYVTVVDSTGGSFKGICLVPALKGYAAFDASNLPESQGSDPKVSIEKLKALPVQADEALGAREIDGRDLEGFRVREDDVTTTVWIDPATGVLARAEIEFARAPGMNMILSDFQFDVPLDDSLFSLTPPEGFTPMATNLQADMSQVDENDLIEFLRLWSSWTMDRTFPPTIIGTEIAKIAMQMGREGRFVGPQASGYEHERQAKIMYRGMLFMGRLPSGTWRYAGQNVSFGDPLTPIFWYQPAGSTTWRVIYADLHTADVVAANLPK